MTRSTCRTLLRRGLAADAVPAMPAHFIFAAKPNAAINLGFMSCGGRADELMGLFSKIDGVNVAGLCDPDRSRLESTKKRFPNAKTCTDMRGLLDAKEGLLRDHGIEMTSAEIKLSPMLRIDPRTERFVGPGSEQANGFLKRQYREPFAVPEIVS